MSRSRSASATTSLPKPAALVPDGIGRSTAAVSSLLTSISRVSGGSTSRVDMGYFQADEDGTERSTARSPPLQGMAIAFGQALHLSMQAGRGSRGAGPNAI